MIFLNINKVDIHWFPKPGTDAAITTVERQEFISGRVLINSISVECPNIFSEAEAVDAGTYVLKQHLIMTARYNRHCFN